jgi:hypothetical protein
VFLIIIVEIKFQSMAAEAAPTAPSALPEFEDSVRLVFDRWTALTLAVDHAWGGDDSDEKREDLIFEICEFAETKGALAAWSIWSDIDLGE